MPISGHARTVRIVHRASTHGAVLAHLLTLRPLIGRPAHAGPLSFHPNHSDHPAPAYNFVLIGQVPKRALARPKQPFHLPLSPGWTWFGTCAYLIGHVRFSSQGDLAPGAKCFGKEVRALYTEMSGIGWRRPAGFIYLAVKFGVVFSQVSFVVSQLFHVCAVLQLMGS